jgi:hypothetical protein
MKRADKVIITCAIHTPSMSPYLPITPAQIAAESVAAAEAGASAELIARARRSATSAKLLFDAGDLNVACNRAYSAMFDAARAALLPARSRSNPR